MSWLPKNCVVVPVDFSDQSIAALDEARQLVESPTRLHVVHVLPVLSSVEPGMIWDTIDDGARRDHAEQALRERLADPKWEGVELAVRIGDPASEIVDFASGVGADIIVLPSHGRTGLTHLLIGSVAERVIRLAKCPVLVLKEGP
jgi:nucleotide-binding universal stress UspA family protein